jgi:integrase
MSDKPIESWRGRAAVSEALDVFNSSYLQDVWNRALARRESDPPGAVTSARTLLETICKHILDSAHREFKEGIPLPQLYRLTAEELQIAPSENTAPIFKKLFESCAEVIESIGRLRNELSDSHGHGPFGQMPEWRHSELAVNLSAAMATYLAAIWKGRQPTVRDVIRNYMAAPPNPIGPSKRYILEKWARDQIGNVVASKLQPADVVAYIEARTSEGDATPMTLNQYVIFLRGALGPASASVITKASQILRSRKMIGAGAPRTRRPSSHELERLITYFQKADQHENVIIPMAIVLEFALYSGRRLGEICALRWKDFNEQAKTCVVHSVKPNKKAGQSEEVPLLGRAFELVMAQERTKDPRIFPYQAKSASQRFAAGRRALGIKGLRLNDMRRECAIRLAKDGYSLPEIAKVLGREDLNALQRDIADGLAQEALQSAAEVAPAS